MNPGLGSTLCDANILMKLEYSLDLENEEVEQGEILCQRTQQVMPEPRTTQDPTTSLATACRKTSCLSSVVFVYLLIGGFAWWFGFFPSHVCKYICSLCSL